MKLIKYKTMTVINQGTEEKPELEQIFDDVVLGWSEAAEEMAKYESYDGKYTIEDDESIQYEDDSDVPTRLDRLEAQIAYTALMTDSLIEEV